MTRQSIRRLQRAVAFLSLMLLTGSGDLFAGAEGWLHDDFEKAKALAAEENKHILIEFTGSDWCMPCAKLNRAILQNDEFNDEVSKAFVLLELDFPQRKPQSDEVKKKNRELATQYGVRGFPTLILTDEQGRPYAKTGFKAIPFGAYAKELADMKSKCDTRDAHFENATKATGLQKADLLDKALSEVHLPFLAGFYSDATEEIKRLDPENQAGLKKKYGLLDDYFAIKKMASDDTAKKEELTEKVDAFLAEAGNEGPMVQEVLMIKAGLVPEDQRAEIHKRAAKAVHVAISAAAVTAQTQQPESAAAGAPDKKVASETGTDVPRVVMVKNSDLPKSFPSGRGPTPVDRRTMVEHFRVLKWKGHTYYACSYPDNRSAANIVKFDSEGNVVQQLEKPGARYIRDITFDEVAEIVTFWGQADRFIDVKLSELE